MLPCSKRSLRSLTRRIGCVLLLLVVALGGAACSSSPPSRRLLLEVIISPRSNQNSPVPIAFVAVTNPKLLEKVLEMNAKQWFEQREQLHRDFPGGDGFTEWEWEYVPGQSPPPTVIEVDGRAIGAMIFANYRSAGDHRFRVGPIRKMRINLEDEDFSVSPLEDTGE